jgi:photosystem II stability/assembly factor-like uncharacterized protein
MSTSSLASGSKCAFRSRKLILFLSLLAFSSALVFPFHSGPSATSRAVSRDALDARTESAGRTPGIADTPGVPAAADPNATLIYSQPYDGRGSEGPSTKIPTGQQMDQEVADDFELDATITRVRMSGPAPFNAPPNPEYHGVYVRFYEGSTGTPGAQQAEYFLPKGAPGVSFNAERPGIFDITLPTPFNAAGRHFISVQPVFVGHSWSASSGGYPKVRGAVTQKRDRLAGGAWAPAGAVGYRNDTQFDLFGTLQSPPRIERISANPIPRSGLVRINGSHFGARSDGQLTIDGKPSPYIAHWADNLIVAYVPETSTLGDVPVSVTSSGQTGTATLNVTTRPTDGRIRWRFTVAGDLVRDRAAIAPDGTVYFHDMEGRLYALSPNGGLKWVFQTGLVANFGPVSVGTDGTVYAHGLVPKNPSMRCEADQFLVNVEGIFAINPDGTQKWLFDKTCDHLLSGPTVGPDGKIHAVTDSLGIGAFALNPDGTLAHAPTGRFGVDGANGTEIVFGPAAPGQPPTQKYFQYESSGLFGYTLEGQRVFLYEINSVGISQPVVGQRTGTIYTTPDQQTAGRLFAVTPQGALRWASPIRPISSLSIPDAPPSESAVYIVQDDVKLHRVNPADGSVVWTFNDNFESLFDPVASPDDRLVLMGGRANYNQPGFFEAVSSDGQQLWKQLLPNEPDFAPYGQVRALNRARFTNDGQTAYIAGNVAGANSTVSNPTYSFFYALDTSNNSAPINQPPKATLTSPQHNSNVPVRTEINITARAEDDGQIARVEFYAISRGTQTLLGSDTTPDAAGSYDFKFTPTIEGTYSIVAAAYDVEGLRGDSSFITVLVSSLPPTVAWVNPIDGSSFAAPASITLTARAADSDGKVAGVEFKSYQTGVVGYNVIGSDTTPDANGNYQIEWANPPQGTYELTATAIDNSGLSRGAVITITIGPASTPVYAIGGTVRDAGGSPMSGVSVSLGNSLSATATTGADGSYLFSDLKGGGNYSVTASRAGYSFTPSQHVFNNLGANQTANFNGARNSYPVSGQIKDNHNVGLASVTINVSGGQTNTIFYTDANGNYSFQLPAGDSYTLTPTLVNYTFAPVSQSFNNLSASQTANFTGTRNTHGISGRVLSNGITLGGVTVTLTGSQTGTATTDPSGYFSFNLPAGGTYTITPSHSDYSFSPASLTFSGLSGNMSGSFAATSTNQAPQVTVSSPLNNSTFVAPATITVGADATDPDGAISKVEFFAEYATGPFKFQLINLGIDTTAPYSTTWSYSGADSFNLRAVATDDRGVSKNSEPVLVTFTVDPANQTPGWQKQFASTRPEMNGAPFETYGFSAVDELHAWASHINAKVSHTTDGGLTWNTVEVQIDGGNNNHAQDVDFIDTQIGWVVGGEDNAVLRSGDGGRTFVRQPTGIPASLFGVDAVDANTVFAVGHTYAGENGSGSIVLRTRDGGATWTEISHPFRHHTRSSFYAVHFINQTTGWVAGSSGNVIKTTNGGSTWTDVSVPTELPLSDVSFADANHGWVVGYNGVIFRTTDAGATWQQQNAGTSDAVLAVSAVSPTVAWISAGGFPGFVARTTDGGVTWHREYPDVNPNGTPNGPTSYSAVLFFNAESGWAAGYSGIYRRGAVQTPPPATYSISGRVTDGAGASILGATITLAGSRSAVIQTSADGSYSFNGLPVGSYTVTPGSNSHSFNPPTVAFNNLSGNQTANFVGTPALFNISGRVRDASGNGINGATVALSGSRSATTQTDANGGYSFAQLVAGGNYTVTPSINNLLFSPVNASFNNLRAAQVADFVGAPVMLTINGRVSDQSGNPLNGATITLSGAQSATTTTDAGGNYSFANLPAGANYIITPSRVNYTFASPSAAFNSLSANGTANFSATLNLHGIGGQVIENGSALSGVTITLSGSQSATTTTDASGRYSFNLPAGGNYTVAPSLANYRFNQQSLSFNNLAGNQTGNFTATRNTFAISGHIGDSTNASLSGVTVTLSGAQSATTNTDANGNYSFAQLPAGGDYTVTPARNFFNFNPANLAVANLSSNQTANFAGAQVLFNISGRVRDASGNGLDAVTVTLSGARTASVQTDANGQYVFRDLPASGNYLVTAAKADYTFNPAHASFANLRTSETVDFTAVPTTARVEFSAANFTAGEGGGRISLSVTRTGDTSSAVTVAYATTDNTAVVRCDDNTTLPGTAFARCDYATSVGQITFAPGEKSASFTVPLVDDSHQESSEWVEVVLSDPSGATLGDQVKARFMITDNDAPNGPNVIDANEFFVRSQYLDFLNREPDADGMAAWLRVLNNCANVNTDPACDRKTVSASFFRSQEFQLKGLFVYLFYKVALNRLPEYGEITPDMSSVSGQSEAEVYRKRAGFAEAFAARAPFREQYDALSDDAFVNTLLNRYNLTAITTHDPANPEATQKVRLTNAQLVSQLSARTLSRAQVLRAVVQSDEVAAVEYHGAFVAMQYYGYLRRTPEASGFNAWLNYLKANPSDYRTMVGGFVNSFEYRLRFGDPEP